MKKRIVCLMATCLLGVSLLAGCGSSSDTTGTDTSAQDQTSEDSGNKTIEKLNVAFVPSKDPDEIITATEPLKDMLKTELGKEGYDVGEVDITVGTSYEAVGEALSAGTADVGLIPGTELLMEAHAPFGGLLRIRLLETSMALHRDDAACILIKEEEPAR